MQGRDTKRGPARVATARRRRKRWTVGWVLVLAAAGCEAGVGGRFDSGGTPLGSADGGTTGYPDSGGKSGTGGWDDGTDTGGSVKYDVGALTSSGTTGMGGGCAKADFLFVIDNSTSMHNEQDALVDSYDDFMIAIEQSVAADDYHVMVVDTDADTRCTKSACKDETPSNKVQQLCLDPHNGYACKASFDSCDRTLGAGVVHPAGDEASNTQCPVSGNKRYLDDSDDLIGTFGCIARVGTAGAPSERPMDAMQAALEGGGGCNGGFLRDDAILVITFITDDPCYEDSGTPQMWYDAVVAAKNGNPDAVVVVGIIPSLTCHYNPDSCESNADAVGGAHWEEFVQLWGTHGLAGDVCAPDSYPGLFASAVSVIDQACDAFEPPG